LIKKQNNDESKKGIPKSREETSGGSGVVVACIKTWSNRIDLVHISNLYTSTLRVCVDLIALPVRAGAEVLKVEVANENSPGTAVFLIKLYLRSDLLGGLCIPVERGSNDDSTE
jgi:hypothetical protein